MKEPEISVGIVSSQELHFTLHSSYLAKGETTAGQQKVSFVEGGVEWNNVLYRELTFTPLEDNATFSLEDVTIGVSFHWERRQTQIFPGTLKLIVDEGKITAINILPLEQYLCSVISSEMNASSSSEFLKAHAVISRSWFLAQIEKRNALLKTDSGFFPFIKSETEHIRWYDREEHTAFDVCADDHCQRYQGVTMASAPSVVNAVHLTRGQVLMHSGTICDTRFSKCCGGMTEEFSTCWENKDFPYLKAVRDEEDGSIRDLTDEKVAEKWIRSSPQSWCDSRHGSILRRILNNYDLETHDFYRWTVRYTQSELSRIVNHNSKSDYGSIIDLIPVERGKSGRLSKLKIVGTLKTMTIGKELEIRRVLSSSHLLSSAFVVTKGPIDENGLPEWFELTGAGWGHGVGLCQIGAAVMGEQGYSYNDILLHYYRGAEIRELY